MHTSPVFLCSPSCGPLLLHPDHCRCFGASGLSFGFASCAAAAAGESVRRGGTRQEQADLVGAEEWGEDVPLDQSVLRMVCQVLRTRLVPENTPWASDLGQGYPSITQLHTFCQNQDLPCTFYPFAHSTKT